MATEVDPSWRLCGSAELALRYWDGDYVVYNPLTGSTHVLDILAGEVLKSIGAGRGRLGELSRHVAEFLEVPDDSGVIDNVREILVHLDDLGLIEPVDGC